MLPDILNILILPEVKHRLRVIHIKFLSYFFFQIFDFTFQLLAGLELAFELILSNFNVFEKLLVRFFFVLVLFTLLQIFLIHIIVPGSPYTTLMMDLRIEEYIMTRLLNLVILNGILINIGHRSSIGLSAIGFTTEIRQPFFLLDTRADLTYQLMVLFAGRYWVFRFSLYVETVFLRICLSNDLLVGKINFFPNFRINGSR